MPKSGSTDIPNIRITDHKIRVPGRLSPDELEDQTRFIRMAGLVDATPSLRQEADGFVTYYEQFTDRPGMLDSAAVLLRRAEQAGEDGLTESWIRLWHLQEDYAAIRRASQASNAQLPEDAWTYYRIGEAYSAIGDANRAVTWYQRAVSLGPDHLRFQDKLGVALTQAQRLDEALSTFDRLLAGNPKFETSLNNRGFLLLLMGDTERAEEDFVSALALSPDMELALANYASLLINTDRADEAREIVRNLIRRFPSNPDYLQVWDYLNTL